VSSCGPDCLSDEQMESLEYFVDRIAVEIKHPETCSYGMKATTMEILEHFITRKPYCEYFRNPNVDHRGDEND
jgi:radical SAM superfamily enzyme